MRIISLNIWHGTMLDKLTDFLKKESKATDIFVFQEMDEWKGKKSLAGNATGEKRVYSRIKNVLHGFTPHNSAAYIPSLGTFLAIFVKKPLIADKQCSVTLSRPVKLFGFVTRSKLLCVRVNAYGKKFWICDTHGLLMQDKWREDTPERTIQSRKILGTLSKFKEPKILCGDFNLPLGGRSMQMLSGKLENLIETHKIKNTRSKIYLKKAKYAHGAEITDHVLISNGIQVNDFKVMSKEVSDHLPLQLKFTLTKVFENVNQQLKIF